MVIPFVLFYFFLFPIFLFSDKIAIKPTLSLICSLVLVLQNAKLDNFNCEKDKFIHLDSENRFQ